MSLIVSIRCSECSSVFPISLDEYRAMGMNALPKACPKCLDIRQERPDVTIDRKEIFSVLCRVSSLPGEWQRVERPNDFPGWRQIVKGQRFGASWSGRIDLWTIAVEPPRTGDVVYLREMEVTKKVAMAFWERATLEHGTVSGYRQVPLGTGGDVIEEERRYIRLDPAPERDPGKKELVWTTAYTKTTLKGLGRRFHAHLEGNPLWYQYVSGGVRSGRLGTEAWLAVVDPDHPVIRVFREDGHEIHYKWPTDTEVDFMEEL